MKAIQGIKGTQHRGAEPETRTAEQWQGRHEAAIPRKWRMMQRAPQYKADKMTDSMVRTRRDSVQGLLLIASALPGPWYGDMPFLALVQLAISLVVFRRKAWVM